LEDLGRVAEVKVSIMSFFSAQAISSHRLVIGKLEDKQFLKPQKKKKIAESGIIEIRQSTLLAGKRVGGVGLGLVASGIDLFPLGEMLSARVVKLIVRQITPGGYLRRNFKNRRHIKQIVEL